MRKLLALLLAAALLALFSACTQRDTETATVWLLTPPRSSDGVRAVEVDVPEGQDAGRAALLALLTPPDTALNAGLMSPFGSGVELVSLGYYGGIATVEFSPEYLDMTGSELALAEGCTALTLLSLERVSNVRILADGAPHPEGEQDFLSAGEIATGDVGESSLERELTLYFRSDETGRLTAERRGIVMREGETVERYVVEELIKGPTQDGLSAVLPEALELVGVRSESGACLLDFSDEFDEVSTAPRTEELLALASIVNSLVVSSSTEVVYLSSEGEALYGGAALGECRGESDPFGYAEFEVWLPSNDGEYVEPASVMLNVSGAYTLDRLLVEYLIGGADGAGFDSVLPPETSVVRMTSSSSYCNIDFSPEFAQNMAEGDYSQELALASLVHTLSANGYASYGVEISVDGEPYAFASTGQELVHPDYRG